MTWPPQLPPGAETESITSTVTPATPTPTPTPTPLPIVTIQTARTNHDAEEMASRIERLQKSRGVVEGSTRERLYRKLVEEGFLTGVAKLKEEVGREVPGTGRGEVVGTGNIGPMGKEVVYDAKRRSVEVGKEKEKEKEKEKGFGGVRVACNAERALQLRAVHRHDEPIQGTADREANYLCDGGRRFKEIAMYNKQCGEGISNLGQAQLGGSHYQQHFKVDGLPTGHRAGSARALASPVEHTSSPVDLADSAGLNSHKWASFLFPSGDNNPPTQKQSTPTPTPLSESQQSSTFSNANQAIVSSSQQPEQAQKQTTAAGNMPPEPAGDRVLRRSARPSSAKAQATIHALYESSAADTPLSPGPPVPETAPLPPVTLITLVTPASQELPKASLAPVTTVSQELPKQDEGPSIPPKQARHAQFITPTPTPKQKKAKGQKRAPSPVQIPGHSYTSTGRHHGKCKQCKVMRGLEEAARTKADWDTKHPDHIVRQPTPFGAYPDDKDWQKTSIAHKSLETRNPFLGSTSASLTTEVAGHMPSTGMGVRSRTEGGAWDMGPMYMYAGTLGGVDGGELANQDVNRVYVPDNLQGVEREHPNIPRARQEELNWLVRTNQITCLDLLAEVALADWKPDPPGPWTGRPAFPESHMRGVREDPKLDYKSFTEEDRAMAANDTHYEGEARRQKSNGSDAFSLRSGHAWNENRAIRYAQEDIRYAYCHDQKHTLYGQGIIRSAPRDISGCVPAVHAPVTPIMERHIFKVNQDGSGRWYSLVYSPTMNAMRGDYGTTVPVLNLNQWQVVEQHIIEGGGLDALEDTEVEEAFKQHLAGVKAATLNKKGMAVKGGRKASKNEEKGVEAAPQQDLAAERAVPKTTGKRSLRGDHKKKVEAQGLSKKDREEEVDPDKTDTDSELEYRRNQSWRPATKKGAIVENTTSRKAMAHVESVDGICEDIGRNGRARGKRSATDAEIDGCKIEEKRAKADGDKAIIQNFSEGEKEGSSGNEVMPAKPVMGLFTDELIQLILPKNFAVEAEKAELDGGEKKENQVIKEASKAKVQQSSDGEKQGGNGVGAGKSAMGWLVEKFKKILPKEVEELEEGEIYEGEI